MIMNIFKNYRFCLNSPDVYDPDLPLKRSPAKGGTLVMWHSDIHKYVTPLETSSSSVLPIIVSLPGFKPSCHIAIYMLTAGHDELFVVSMSALESTIGHAKEKFGEDTALFIRGDMNASEKNTARFSLLLSLMEKFDLKRVKSVHFTYHHFLGLGGEFDSDLDVLLSSNSPGIHEVLQLQICKNDHLLVQSHHDVLISGAFLPPVELASHSHEYEAPKLVNNRVKILWDEAGISDYQKMLEPHLDELASRWFYPDSPANVSVLISATNSILCSAAAHTNKYIELGIRSKPKSQIDPEISRLQKNVLTIHRERTSTTCPIARKNLDDQLCAARSAYKRKIGENIRYQENKRDTQLSSINRNPSDLYWNIRKSRNENSGGISKLNVAGTTFQNISDGFHKSLSLLKDPDMSTLESTPAFQETLRDFGHIMKLVEQGEKIPAIEVYEAIDILYSVRSDVNDLFSITASHYINAGSAGLRHFHRLLSACIDNVNNSKLNVLNDILAMVLFKGHGKDKENDRSYRTISTCPLLTKCLNIFIGRHNYHLWHKAQAPTQFQGEGSSHELASLLLTEAINHSLHISKSPLFVLLLDAKSAFDVVIRQNAIVEAYKAGTKDQGLIYLNNRLKNRRTFPQWETTLMGPILDKRGLEQGAVNSDRLYKLVNNSQLQEAQDSGLGIDLKGVSVASIGQADDCALIADSPFKLLCLLHLTMKYCERQHVELVPENTKLLVWTPKSKSLETHLLQLGCSIAIDGKSINYSDFAEHVGVRRSVNGGNMPHIVDRIGAHTRALAAILHTGAARNHLANPSSCLQLEKIYGGGVLFSGTASLVLSEKEISSLSRHFRHTICKLQKLPLTTPSCVIFFLAGSLPAVAVLHLRILGLFGMIARSDPSSILQQIGRRTLLSDHCSKFSWFEKVRAITQLYLLPDPLLLLQNPPSKEYWKKMCLSKILDHWEVKFRAEAASLPSLQYFKPEFMSLSKPHPIWTLPENSHEVLKATTVAMMISGKYNSDYHVRHWSRSNPEGYCQLCLASQYNDNLDLDNATSPTPPLGTLDHLLLECKSLKETRDKFISLWLKYTSDNLFLQNLFMIDGSCKPSMQFLLDPLLAQVS